MRAVVLNQSPWSLHLDNDWPAPQPAPGEVIVRVHGVAVCGSDLDLVAGHRRPPSFPWVPGHEAFGEIAAVGTGVDESRIGQRVVIEPNYPCLSCKSCVLGSTSACADRVSLGFTVPGALAELVAVPSEFAWDIPPGWSSEDAVCTEPLTVALAAMRKAGVGVANIPRQTGEAGRCLVIGAGSQGTLMCVALVARGYTPFVLEPQEGRRALAASLGATPVTQTEVGFDLVFETSGAPSAVAEAISRAASGALILLVGLSGASVELDTDAIVRRQLRVQGSLIYDHPRDFGDTIAKAIPSMRPGRVIHACYSLDEADTAFRAAREVPGKTWIRLAEESDAMSELRGAEAIAGSPLRGAVTLQERMSDS